MSMTVITLMDAGGSGDTMYVGDQLDQAIVAALGRTVYPDLVGLDEVSVSPSTAHGGFVSARYGTMTIAIDAFARAAAAGARSMWPPPKQISIEALEYYVDPTTVIAPLTSLAPLTGWMVSMSGTGGVTYAIYTSAAMEVSADNQTYLGTLNYCAGVVATALGVPLNTTYARASSPAVYYRADGKVRSLDALDAMCRFFTHLAFLDYNTSGTLTLYLVDQFRDNGTLILADDEWETVEYTNEQPHSIYTAQWTQGKTTRLKLAIDAIDGGYNSCLLATAQIFYGTVELGRSAYATDEASGYPATNLQDTNTSTLWISGPGTVPTTELYLVSSSAKKISNYTLTARNDADTYAPSRWRLFGWHEALLDYYPLGEVESTGWAALEARTFSVPDCNWPAEFASDYPYGDIYTVSPTCAKTHAQVVAALSNINHIVNKGRTRVRLILPVRADIKIGRKVAIVDRLTCNCTVPSWAVGLSGALDYDPPYLITWLRPDSITYDFLNQSMIIEGQGVIA